jgi:hypothetical protein
MQLYSLQSEIIVRLISQPVIFLYQISYRRYTLRTQADDMLFLQLHTRLLLCLT